jgi:DNA polymerase
MSVVLGFDAETSSTVDLPRLGADVYTRDPGTRCLMFVYHQTASNQPYQLWLEGQPPPAAFVAHAQTGCLFTGWNVLGFDRNVYNRILVPRHGFPAVEDDRWLDSMHLAAHANLPRSLAGAGRAVGITFQEDLKDSNRLRRITDAKRTTIPAPVATILAEPAQFDPKLVADLHWLVQRCLQDVPMEEQILLRLPPWPTTEPWLAMPAIDRRINDRGVFIDVPLVQGLAKAAALEMHRLDDVMARVTDGYAKKCTEVEKLKTWLVGNGVDLPPNEPPADEDEEREDDQDDKAAEKDRKSPWRLRKSDLADLLAKTDIPDKCHDALALRAEAAKVSVHKLRAMLRRVAADGRIYQAFSLGGAQATMRWSSGGVQLQNYVRDTYANFEEVAEVNRLDAKRDKVEVNRLRDIALATGIQVGRTGDPELMRCLYQMQKVDLQGRSYTQGVLLWISRMLRATLCVPEGHLLLNGDYSNIEARIPVWLAGQEDVVGQFARGEDVYRHRAAPIYGKSPEALTREERQIGKVTTLFCGFGAGPRAFVPAAMNYGITVSLDAGAKIIKTFRDTNTALVEFWDANLRCALEAVCYPGKECSVPPKGLVAWKSWNNCLMCRLPSGRILRYRGVHLAQGTWPDGRPKSVPDIRVLVVKGKQELPRTLWRGLAMENITQAIAADMLGVALANMDRLGLPVVLHCHDSLAAEVRAEQAERLLPLFKEAMLDMPAWTNGLPMAAEVHYGARFA